MGCMCVEGAGRSGRVCPSVRPSVPFPSSIFIYINVQQDSPHLTPEERSFRAFEAAMARLLAQNEEEAEESKEEDKEVCVFVYSCVCENTPFTPAPTHLRACQHETTPPPPKTKHNKQGKGDAHGKSHHCCC